MTPFQQKITTLLQLAKQYQTLAMQANQNNNLASLSNLITVLQQEEQKWNKTPNTLPTDWLELFEEAYNRYDQACCANKLSAKDEKKLKREMEKAIEQGEKILKQTLKKKEENPELQQQLIDTKAKLNALSCANSSATTPEEIFVPHVHDHRHFIGGDEDAGNFFSILDGEYNYNKSLSSFLITPEYIDSILHELNPLLDNYKHNLKGAIQSVKDEIKAARAAAKERKKTVPKKRIAQLKDKIEQMKDKLQLMKEKIKELEKEKKQAEKAIKKDTKALKKEGLVDDIQRHKGNIDGYLDAAYISKFKRAGDDYVANCQKEEPSERVATYLMETMERLIMQLTQEIKDADCTNLLTGTDKAQMNSIREQMQKSLQTLESNCTFEGLPHYKIEDIHPDTVVDHCGNLISLKAERKVTKVSNPNFKPQTLDYQNILATEQATTEITYLPNLSKQTALPTAALQAAGFDIDGINTYFANNPNSEEYTTPLSLETGVLTPMVYTVSDGELQPIKGENNWTIGWKTTRTIKAELATDCETLVQWSHIWTKKLNKETTQPNLVKDGSGKALPTETVNSNNIKGLYEIVGGKPSEITVEIEWNFNIRQEQRIVNIPFITGEYDFQTSPESIPALQDIVTLLKQNPMNRVTLQPRTLLESNREDGFGEDLIQGRQKTLQEYFESIKLSNQTNIIIQNDSYSAPAHDVIINLITVDIDI